MACRIAVCDDNPIDLAYVGKFLDIWSRQREIPVLVETFSSAEAFLFRYEEDKTFDLLLLDIEMGGMDGVTLARQVRRDSEDLQLVFITGYWDYIGEGYDVSALHYLLKPVRQEKLFAVLDKGIKRRRQEERFLNLESPGETVRIPLGEIRYLEVCRNYVTVHGRKDYTVKRPLRDFEHLLEAGFCRAGRSLILNPAFIRRVTRREVHLSEGTILPLLRGAYEPLNQAIIHGRT